MVNHTRRPARFRVGICWKRALGRTRAGRREARPPTRGARLERLEPRLLLSINPMTPVAGITGADAPPIQLNYANGAPFTIEAIDEPILVMDFWASWCGPCMLGLPLLHDFADWAEANDKPVEVVTINVGESVPTALAAWAANGFSLPIAMDPMLSAFTAYASIYNNNGIPFTVMVAGGKITSHHVGYDPALNQTLQAEVNALEPLLPDDDGAPEIDVTGNGMAIDDGQAGTSLADGTAFGTVHIDAGPVTHAFTIHNNGDATLALTGAPRVAIEGADAADFTVVQAPPATIATGGMATFQVAFDPSTPGVSTATVRIASDDADEDPYDFVIEGAGTDVPLPEIAIAADDRTIMDGDTTPDAADHTLFPRTEVEGGTSTRTFTIHNSGTATLTLTANPPVAITGPDAADFTVLTQPAAGVAPGDSTTFQVQFDPTASGIHAATVVVASNDADEDPYDFAIRGTGAGLPHIAIGDVTQAEGDADTSAFVFTLTLSEPSLDPVQVVYAVVGDTATAGVDFVADAGPLVFAPHQVSTELTVLVHGDTDVESDETFTVLLTDPVQGLLDVDQAAGVIANDDVPDLFIADASIPEGDDGLTGVELVVTLSEPSPDVVSVDYLTADGTAGAADYVATAGTLLFAPGTTESRILLSISGDTWTEHDETFRVVLSNPNRVAIVDGEGVVTIENDDLPLLSVDPLIVTEMDHGTRSAIFTLRLSQPGLELVTVDYTTADDTAIAPADYITTQGSLHIRVGDVTGRVVVPIRGDRQVEVDESLLLQLSGVTGADLDPQPGRATILDNDVPEASIADLRFLEGDDGVADARFDVTLSQPPLTPVVLHYTTSDGYATAGTDYVASSGTVELAPGQTHTTIDVPVIGETVAERDETFYAHLTGADNATIARGAAEATVVNQDGIGVLVGSGGARSVLFTDADGTTARVTVSRGSGVVRLVGDDLQQHVRGSRVVVTGVDVRLADVVLSPSEPGATLRVQCRGGDGLIVVGGISAPWSVGAVIAPCVDLAGGLEVGRDAGQIVLHDLLPDSSIRVGTSHVPHHALTLRFNDATDATLHTSGAVQGVQGLSWRDLNANPESITATQLGRYAIAGESSVSLMLGGAPAGRAVLGRAAVGRLTGGHWSIAGDGLMMAAGSVAGAWSGRFDGNLGAFRVATDMAGDFEANSAGRIDVGGNLFRANIRLLGVGPRGRALDRLNVGGVVRYLDFQSAGDVGAIAADLLLDSTFDVLASIDKVLVKGRRGRWPWINRTNLQAAEFGRISMGFAGANQGEAYGFTAASYGRIDYRGPAGRQALGPATLGGAGETPIDADLVVRVL